MKVLITGAAGFIGYHLTKSLINDGHQVVGLDNINDYYDCQLKYDRLSELGVLKKHAMIYLKVSNSIKYPNSLKFIRMNLEDRLALPNLFTEEKFDLVCNLAAQAGVRYSIKNPNSYVDSNIVGFLNVLECCRHNKIKRLVYASSSSIYGNSMKIPFSENDKSDEPVSLYAASKKSNELMAYTYAHLYKIETIGLRFFTVYGPWGRPDMAYFMFTKSIYEKKEISVFNGGNLSRDFTYIDDIIEGIKRVLITKSKNKALNRIYNIGNNSAVNLNDFISIIENIIDKKSKKVMLPMQQGDVKKTWADVSLLISDYSYSPKTPIEKGIKKFISWYNEYYKKI